MSEKMNFKDRKLYRSHENRMIGGVCGGVAEYFQVDPTLIRLIWIATALFGGIGVIIYIASLIIIPINPEQSPSDQSENLIKDKPLFWGSLLIIIGVFLLFRQFGFFYAFNFWKIPWQSVWAIVLILVGVLLLFNRTKKDSEERSAESSRKKLYRSRNQRMIAGVCGGLAEYFQFDVSIIRVLWILATILSVGIGIVAYIVMMFVFPEETDNIAEKM